MLGNYWKGIESIIVSQVYDESSPFVSKFIQNTTDVEIYVEDLFPQTKLSGLKTAVLKQYPADAYPYGANARSRTAAVIRDMYFTCNTRLLYDAYHNEAKTYMMEYDVLSELGLATHGADLIPLFLNSESDIIPFLEKQFPPPLNLSAEILAKALKVIAPRFQSYFASHAIYGDPNRLRKSITPHWNPATNGSNYVEQVMEVTARPLHHFNPAFTDVINSNDACDFWKEAAWNITNLFPGASYSFQTREMQEMHLVLHEEIK